MPRVAGPVAVPDTKHATTGAVVGGVVNITDVGGPEPDSSRRRLHPSAGYYDSSGNPLY